MPGGVPDRKPRVQGKIANLTPAQQRQLRAWMHEGLSYKEIADRARKQFSVTISQGSLSNYYSKHQREIVSEGEDGPTQPVHVKLVLHVEVRPEIIHPTPS